MFLKYLIFLLAITLSHSQNDTLLVAFASNNECDEKILESAKNGANVIIWGDIYIIDDPTTKEPEVGKGNLNIDCVAKIIKNITDLGL